MEVIVDGLQIGTVYLVIVDQVGSKKMEKYKKRANNYVEIYVRGTKKKDGILRRILNKLKFGKGKKKDGGNSANNGQSGTGNGQAGNSQDTNGYNQQQQPYQNGDNQFNNGMQNQQRTRNHRLLTPRTSHQQDGGGWR